MTGEEDQERLLGVEETEVLAVMEGESFKKKSSPGKWAGRRFLRALTARPRSTGSPAGSRVRPARRDPGFLAAAMGPIGMGLENFGTGSEASVSAFTLYPLSPDRLTFYVVYSGFITLKKFRVLLRKGVKSIVLITVRSR